MAFGISTWVDGQEDMIHMTPFNYIEEHALVAGTRTITVDTSKYSVLCFNIPGNGFNENNFDFNLDLNLGDIALLFVKAINQLKLAKLHAIIGGSIGGCLTWEMIALKNDLASIIIPVAADWKATDWLIANTFLQERILKNSRDPVSDARIHAMTFYRSPKSLNTRFTRTKNLDKNMYNVESWLSHHGEKLRQRFSLESYLFMNKLLSSTDITRDGESFINKISKIKSSIDMLPRSSIDSMFGMISEGNFFGSLAICSFACSILFL